MRSDDVFGAAKKIGNRFLLCRVASVYAHRLQVCPRPFAESINKSLKLITAIVPLADDGGVPGKLRMSGDQLLPTLLGDVKSGLLAKHQAFEPPMVTVGLARESKVSQ